MFSLDTSKVAFLYGFESPSNKNTNRAIAVNGWGGEACVTDYLPCIPLLFLQLINLLNCFKGGKMMNITWDTSGPLWGSLFKLETNGLHFLLYFFIEYRWKIPKLA